MLEFSFIIPIINTNCVWPKCVMNVTVGKAVHQATLVGCQLLLVPVSSMSTCQDISSNYFPNKYNNQVNTEWLYLP